MTSAIARALLAAAILAPLVPATPAAAARGGAALVGGTAMDAAAIERALGDDGDAGCRAWVAEQLRGGALDPAGEAPGCAGLLGRALRRAARGGAARFGIVESRREDLSGARLVLSAAAQCRRWLLRRAGAETLLLREALAGRCRVRRLEEGLTIDLIDETGRRVAGVARLTGGGDGRYSLRYGDVEAELARQGLPPLARWRALELGEGGWAARIDLAALSEAWAALHLAEVRRGRGAPALALLLHAARPEAVGLQALAEEARQVREAADYQAVIDGALSPRAFLDRYPRSRYARAVRTGELQPPVPLAVEREGEARP